MNKDYSVYSGNPSMIPERLERLPITRFHWVITLLAGLLYMFESLDLGVTGTVSVILGKFPGHTPFLIAMFGVTSTVGVVVGLLISGPLADIYGKRKILLVGSALLFGLSAVLTIIPANFMLLLIIRMVQGFAAGGIFPFPYTYISEFIPAAKRGYFIAVIDLFFVGGFFLAPLVGLFVVPFVSPSIAWRMVFGISAIPLIFYPLYLKHIPESPRWLQRKGKDVQAGRVVSGIEETVTRQSGTKLPPPSPSKEVEQLLRADIGFKDIFRQKYLRYSIPLWIFTSSMLSIFYISSIYAPRIFISLGYTTFFAFLLWFHNRWRVTFQPK